MYQIDVSSVATTQPTSTALGTTGYFTDGNAATGLEATLVPAEFLNSVMLELMNAVTGAGLTLSKDTFNQLYTAIATVTQAGAGNYASDTGAANAYAVTYTPTVSAPKDGMVRAFKVKTTNTGASTFTLDAQTTAYPIVGLAGTALQGGELVATGIAVLRFNSTLASWVLYHCGLAPTQVAPASASNHAPTAAQVQEAAFTTLVDTGAANAYVTTFSPALSAPVAGAPFWMKVKTANTGASTLNATGTAYPLLGGAHSALVGGELIANGWAQIVWNATLSSYVLLECTGAPVQVAVPTAPTHAAQLANIGNGRGLNIVTASTALTSANVGQLLVDNTAGTAATMTLPSSTTVPAGSIFSFITMNGNGATVSLASSSDSLFVGGQAGGVSVLSIALKVGDTLQVETDGAGKYIVLGGSAALKYSGQFAYSFGSIGYQKLPSGLIIQWGVGSTSSGSVTGTFPLTFPTAGLAMTAVATSSSVNPYIVATNLNSTSTFSIYASNGSGSSLSIGFNWIAIGH